MEYVKSQKDSKKTTPEDEKEPFDPKKESWQIQYNF